MKKTPLILGLASVSLLFIAANSIDLNQLNNYMNQGKPNYITKDNTTTNLLTDKGATLGRVLFYDKKLSANNTISCASCHHQAFAFGDTATQSLGFMGGLTGRHSMRLVNARFSQETKFFWDERAATLEAQTSRPIQDHVEMGYSGTDGQQNINDLIVKLNQTSYYPTLFRFVYGDTVITEQRIQNALAQFVRSIQSFDSKFDVGLAQAPNLQANFSNYTALENEGKTLFLNPPNLGGAGCQGCHRAPEFDIDPNTRNNGVVAVAGTTTNQIDLTNTKAPSLRDVFNPNGSLNGPLMHNGNFKLMPAVIAHYNAIPNNPGNTNLDPRLAGPGGNLNLTTNQQNALVAFLRTLTGSAVYTDSRWSDPFDQNGSLDLVPLVALDYYTNGFNVYPNPLQGSELNIASAKDYSGQTYQIYNIAGVVVAQGVLNGNTISVPQLHSGLYTLTLGNLKKSFIVSK